MPLLTRWQGLGSLLLAGLAFWASRFLLPLLDETTGLYDMGYIQRVFVAAFYLFSVDFVAWLLFQTSFPTINDYLDNSGCRVDWKKLQPVQRIIISFIAIIFIFTVVLVCLSLVPI